jgi:hypothetical protein
VLETDAAQQIDVLEVKPKRRGVSMIVRFCRGHSVLRVMRCGMSCIVDRQDIEEVVDITLPLIVQKGKARIQRQHCHCIVIIELRGVRLGCQQSIVVRDKSWIRIGQAMTVALGTLSRKPSDLSLLS